MLYAMLREDFFTTVRLKWKISPEVKRQVAPWKQVNIEITLLPMFAGTQIEFARA